MEGIRTLRFKMHEISRRTILKILLLRSNLYHGWFIIRLKSFHFYAKSGRYLNLIIIVTFIHDVRFYLSRSLIDIECPWTFVLELAFISLVRLSDGLGFSNDDWFIFLQFFWFYCLNCRILWGGIYWNNLVWKRIHNICINLYIKFSFRKHIIHTFPLSRWKIW